MFSVLGYIHANITNPLLLEDAAKAFGYSKWHFCKKFHEYFNMSFGEYVRHYRMQLAAIDILQGGKITDVALDYGYDTPGGFNKAFLKEYGCFPREYKKQAKDASLYYERRKTTMYKLTDRCNILRDEVVNKKQYEKNFNMQRSVNYVLGCIEAEEKGLETVEVFASGTSKVLDDFVPFIIPGEIITGYNFGAFEGIYTDKTPENIQLMKKNGFKDREIELYFRYAGPYLDKIRYMKGESKVAATLPENESQAQREWAAIGVCTSANHSVISYEKVLKYGFEGLYDQVIHYENKIGSNPLYNGIKKVCKAAMSIGDKYVLEAKRLLEQNDPAYNSEDLDKIIQICSKVPRYPAETFEEAVQSLWFAHIINTWEDSINANSLGRLDQILYPYYCHDLENGAITKEDAFEYICLLWLKLYRDYDVQQSCIGGITADGKSAINDLSYMMLDATEQLDIIRCMSVRYNKDTDKEFLKRALEVVGHLQKGVPFFFNDDVMIPALVDKGISWDDVYDYTNIGCVETVIPGKSNPHAVTGKTNFLKAMEYALSEGHSMMYPDFAPGAKTGSLDTFTTYQKFYEAVLEQVDTILDLTCSQVKKCYDECVDPKPYKSMLTEGCLENAKDFNSGGAKYDYYQIMLGGIPNLADSLAVVRKFVYQDKKYTLRELRQILENNYPDETVRMEFINKSPKFGNDIDEVDNIAVDITNHACDTLEKLSEKYGMSFHPQPFTYLWMIDHGKNSAASPDGRRKGEPIAYSVSPMQGRDFSGLTAVLNTISKFPTKRTPGTTSAIVEVDPKLFTDKNVGILTDILVASSKKGLSNVQFNTVDAETLLDAKNHPEKYNNLAVRVSGFSQKFNLLEPELQEHIIGRTKHKCL